LQIADLSDDGDDSDEDDEDDEEDENRNDISCSHFDLSPQASNSGQVQLLQLDTQGRDEHGGSS